jgi:hypothetical protein
MVVLPVPVQKNIYSLSVLTSLHQIANFNPGKSSDRGCRSKGPFPNLGRLTVVLHTHEQTEILLEGLLIYSPFVWNMYTYTIAYRGKSCSAYHLLEKVLIQLENA